jgi:putative Ca2+/H+ antiporter (TMEM165/GDT1 family)
VDLKTLSVIFATVFIAELGDKTQLATLMFAANKEANNWLVFAGASLALIAASAVSVLAGASLANYASEGTLRLVAGVGFIAVGFWTLLR